MQQKLTKSKSSKPISKWSEYLFDKRHKTPDDFWYFKDDISCELEIMISNLAHQIKINQNCSNEEAKKMAINLIMEQLLPIQRRESSATQRAMIFSVFFDSPDLEDIRNQYFSHIETPENNQRLLNGEPIKQKKSFFFFWKNKSKQNIKKPPSRLETRRAEHFMHELPEGLKNFTSSVETKQYSNRDNPIQEKSIQKVHHQPNNNYVPTETSPTNYKSNHVNVSSQYREPKRKKEKKGFFSFFTRKKPSNSNYENIRNRARH